MTTSEAAPPASAPRARGPAVSERGIARHDAVASERWTARGSIKVLHDSDVEVAELEGTVSIGGALRAGRVRSDGLLEVGGPIAVRELLSGRGELRGGTTLRAGDLSVHGGVKVGGTVTVDRRAEITGWAHVGSVSASEFHLAGRGEIPGTIRAPSVDLRLKDGSALGAVEGQTVRLVGPAPNLIDKVLGRQPRVLVERVEADRAEIAGVDVQFVRAREVTLGPGAHVTAVEGTIVRRHPTSHVGPESKSPAPYGLRR